MANPKEGVFYRSEGTGVEESGEVQQKFTLERLHEWNKYGFDISTNAVDELSLIILGEAHLGVFIPSQIDLIKQVKPSFILHENGKGFNYYPRSKRIRKQEGRINFSFEAPAIREGYRRYMSHLMQTADELKVPIIGCDITYAEFEEAALTLYDQDPENYEIVEHEGDEAVRSRNTGEIIDYGYPEIMLLRDQMMIAKMKKYVTRSTHTVVVVVGAKHGKNIMVRQDFLDLDIPTAFVDQPVILDKVRKFLRSRPNDVQNDENDTLKIWQDAFEGRLFNDNDRHN